MNDKEKVVKLAIDVYKGSTGEFSADEAHDSLRKALVAINGGKEHIDFKDFRRNKIAIFEIMEDALDVLITEGIEDQFADFVDYKNVKHGDKPAFMVDDYNLFPVATIAGGTNNLRRQRLDRNAFYVDTKWKGVAFYDELERFLAGKVDWAKMVGKVNRSFQAQIAKDIYDAIVAGYTALTAPYKFTGAFDLTQYNTLTQHVEAATQRSVMVAGTRLALQNVAPSYVAYNGQLVEQRNQDGFFKVVDGIVHVELKQAHTPGTDSFAIGDKFLLAIPSGEEKIVKLVLEGEAIIEEAGVNGSKNTDDSMEHSLRKKYGVGVVTSTKYGAYILP